jgi:hypothetical protein
MNCLSQDVTSYELLITRCITFRCRGKIDVRHIEINEIARFADGFESIDLIDNDFLQLNLRIWPG